MIERQTSGDGEDDCYNRVSVKRVNLLDCAPLRNRRESPGEFLYYEFQQNLTTAVRDFLKRQYDLSLPNLAVDQPPKISMGEYALPLAFELAKRLRKPPRKVAEELIAGLAVVPGFRSFEIAGAGYINARL